MNSRFTTLGFLLLTAVAGGLFFLQQTPHETTSAASNGSTALNLVKLPSSAGGVSVGLTKLAPAAVK